MHLPPQESASTPGRPKLKSLSPSAANLPAQSRLPCLPSNGEGCEREGDVGVVFLGLVVRSELVSAPHGARLARLAQDFPQSLACCSGRAALLGGDDVCTEAGGHPEAQNALHEDTHGLDVHPSDHGIRPGRAVQAPDELVLAPHRVLQLLALRPELLVPLFAVLEVANDVALLTALLLESLCTCPEHDDPPNGIAVLVVQAIKLSRRHGDDLLRE
mmetsp:Transcript_25401/g.72760  ORF Transcript_25401/g.72760 Transcript_25401/m.72760 type:complete len:216 (+) Transcript_25401:20-667(+)